MQHVILSAIIGLVTISGSTLAVDPVSDGAAGAAIRPESDVALSPIRVIDAKPVTLVYTPLHGSSAEIGKMIDRTLPALYATLLDQHIRVSGAPIFIFPTPTADRSVVVDMDLGIPVPDGTAAPAGFAVRQTDAIKAASSVVTGAGTEATIGYACHEFYSKLNALELSPHGELRMRWLSWDMTTPANSVIQLEVAVVQ